jgi:translation elongation factor EF-Ts
MAEPVVDVLEAVQIHCQQCQLLIPGRGNLEQAFVKDPDKTVSELLAELTVKIGEKLSIRRFARYEVGEGLEKRSDDFAAEVAKQAAGD